MARTCSKPGCQEPHTARGFCHRHYREFLRHGGTRVAKLTRHYGKTPEERFWLYVQKSKRCWEWTGYKNAKGYGIINLRGERVMAHRMAYELAGGSIPDGMFVLHHCDNPGCVKPKHLFLGTLADNNADMWAKENGRGGSMPGTGNHRAKLTEADVRAIRASNESGPVLGARYGVTRNQIWGIRHRVFWKHIE
jgi:hypothetical protein